MRKLLILFILTLCTATCLRGNIGDWTLYLSYQNATQHASAGRYLYALYDGNLLKLDTQTQEVRLFDRTTGLSDTKIARIAYADKAHRLVVAYRNGNIDLLSDDESIVNLPQMKKAGDALFTPRSIHLSGDTAYVAIDNGFATLDLRTQQFLAYYNLNEPVQAATSFAGKLLASTDSELLAIPLTGNALDRGQWKRVAALRVTDFTPLADALFLNVPWTEAMANSFGVWLMRTSETSATGFTLHNRVQNVVSYGLSSPKSCTANSDCALFLLKGKAVRFDKDDLDTPAATLLCPETISYLTPEASGYRASNGFDGVRRFTDKGGTLTPEGEALGGYGPRRDQCHYLAIAGSRLLVAGGFLSYAGDGTFPPTAMTLDGDEWTAFQEKNLGEAGTFTGGEASYNNVNSIVQDPADPTHHFVTSGGTGMLEFRNAQFVKQYSCDNSDLRIPTGHTQKNLVRSDGLSYDKAGNLWMVNPQRDTVIKVLRTDGTWQRLWANGISGAQSVEHTLHDSRGWVWVNNRRFAGSNTGGLVCLDYGGTLDTDSDDLSLFRNGGYNQDGTAVDFTGGVYALAFDRDGSLWVGTVAGLYIVERPEEWFNPDFYFTQVKIPRNDGSGLADYLFADEIITAIAIDDGGRKWIGTAKNGVFLLSPDGTEELLHFTTDNSPLLSNNIYSIALHPSGNVFLGTDRGLCAYQSEASAAMPSLDADAVKAYPNPVRPEYRGNIAIKGLTQDADVKITTLGGHVVAAGRSIGGSFVWNGRLPNGERATTGVYYIMVATSDGSDGVVGKVVVI